MLCILGLRLLLKNKRQLFDVVKNILRLSSSYISYSLYDS